MAQLNTANQTEIKQQIAVLEQRLETIQTQIAAFMKRACICVYTT